MDRDYSQEAGMRSSRRVKFICILSPVPRQQNDRLTDFVNISKSQNQRQNYLFKRNRVRLPARHPSGTMIVVHHECFITDID
jgi:hypothetical protein